MSSYFSFSYLSIIALLLLLPIFGLYLLVTGWRGRRVGTEPRCGQCGYIVLHLTSDQCPECGAKVSPLTTVIGERRRRWGRAGIGLLLLAIACLPLISPVVNAFNAIPWYQYKPAAFGR
jgi:predicted RNA-binding Zn-ribbon protein involved in translation (DUF1610 family)